MSTERLIEVIKKYEPIWNLQNKGYKNRKRKTELWALIANEVGMPVDEVKRKWKSLRDSFSREAKKPKVSEPASENNCDRWQYYDQMLFIKSSIKRRKYHNTFENVTTNYGQSSVKKEEVHLSEESFVSQSSECPKILQPIATMDEQFSMKRKLEEDLQTDDNILHTMKTLNTFVPNPWAVQESDDEDSLFCKSMVQKLRKFPLNVKNYVKVRILCMLNEEEEKLMQ